MVLLGLALVAGGVWLTALGGSWYYVLVGIGLLLTGALLMARRAAALWVYAVVVFGTLVWAVLEVGFDWWQLAPRGGVIVLLGLWLLMPWVTNGLNRGAGARPPAVWRGAGVPLALSLMLAAGSAIWAFLTPSNDLAGRLPTQESATLPADYGGMPAGDWRAYGRTPTATATRRSTRSRRRTSTGSRPPGPITPATPAGRAILRRPPTS
jgi:quinoprotein glucose dehydrogenase